MSGFEHRPLTTIKRIVNDLRDRYQSGFPIIKEIIQNTDDSHSKRLDFGWVRGLPNAQHPLLNGPALFFINNGRFKRSDAQAIRRFGDSEKEGEQTAIGKFGLGQKSIFHLCEAFFYLAHSPNEQFEASFPSCNFLNPWAEPNPQPNEIVDPFHPDWTEFSESDQNGVKAHFKDILEQENYQEHFFILWIPLRQESHRKRKTKDGKEDEVGVIIQNFSGDRKTPPDEIFPANLAGEIGLLLPLLRSLKEVSYWLPDHQAKLQPQFNLTLQGSRRRYPLTNQETPLEIEVSIDGSVQITHFVPEKKNTTLAFSGREVILNNSTLKDIHQHKSWPTSLRIDNKTGNPVQEPDKAFAHCAVTFMQKPATQNGNLSIQWAVFLPLGDSGEYPNEKFPYEGDKDYVVLLHGYFFVDAGRRHIEQWKNSTCQLTDNATEAEVRQKWNQLLTTEGTLKNVLPALNIFIETHKPAPENIWQLSNALKNSDLFRQYGNDICQDFQWVYVADKQKWQCIDSKQPLLSIPQLGTDKTSLLPWEVLPNLQSIQECFITLIEAPNLTTSLSDWSSNQLETVLQDVPSVLVFQDQKLLEYLLSFLKQCVVPLSPNQILPEVLQNRLCDIARKAFARLKVSQLYKLKELVTKFLNFIPEKCFFIDCKTYQATIFFELHKLETHTILIPRTPTFDFPELQITPKQKLANKEALTLLKSLNSIIQDEKYQDIVDDCAAIAWKILCLVADKKALVETHPDLKVLRAHNCRVPQDRTIVSLGEIKNAYQQGTLFLHRLAHSKEERIKFANPLQKVLTDATVIIIETEVADLLGDIGQNEIISCEQLGCLRALSHKPPLTLNSHIEKRAELLKDLLDANVEDKIFTKGIRYLLTLRVESDLADKHPLWYLPSPKHNRFVEQILTARGEKEYLIDDAFVQSVTNKLANDKRTLIGIEELTLIKAIELALSYEQPHIFCQNILDALQYVDIDSLSDSEKQELRQKLRQKWLVDKNGTAIIPEEVVYLPEIKETVSRIIGEQTEQTTYRDYLRLEPGITNHPSFHKLCDLSCFATGREGLDILGLIMYQEEKYHLGQFTNQTFPLKSGLIVFKNIPAKLLPAWEVVNTAREKCSPDDIDSLLEQLFGQLSINQMKDLLFWLKTQHINDNTHHLKIRYVFNSYLKTAIVHPQFDTIFQEIYFLNKRGKWKLPSKLVSDAQISDDFLLDSRQADILNEYLNSHSFPATIMAEPAQQTLKLDEYFREWEGKIVNDEMIGVFLALLGDAPLLADDSNLPKLAEEYLQHYNIDDIRTNLTGESEWHNAKDFWTHFEIHSTQHGDGKVQLTALDGSPISAPLCQEAQSIIISCKAIRVDKISQKRQIEMQLRIIDTKQYNSTELADLLKESIEKLLESIHKQKNTDALEQLWGKLFQTEQLDIDTARRMILENALLSLRQLGIKNNADKINSILTNWDKTRRREKELGQSKYIKERQKTIEELGKVIENDEQTQVAIFEAVRTTVKKYQYTPKCVPFELFQNADDAVVELEELGAISEKTKRFVLRWDENNLTIMHWGRKINKSFSGSKGIERGFDRDLEKMLVFSVSDKTEEVTGKFGLGFKSVFLISQQPSILSGKDMGVKIAAGMLPISLNAKEKQHLSTELQQWQSDDSLEGTIIKLPITPDVDNVLNQVVDHFRSVTGILLAFSKRIKYCVIDSPNEQFDVSWQPNEIIKDISVGDLKLKVEQETMSKALLIENQEFGAILIALDSKGLCHFPNYQAIQDIWVTVPLQESMKLGFAINGRFEIDVGRGRLARYSTDNTERAQKLGYFIGKKLCELFEKSKQQGFNFIKEALDLATDISEYEFWDSVWKILAESWLNHDHPLLMNMLGNWNTVGQLINKYPVFPNGLYGKYQVLNTVKNITYVASGILNEESSFTHVSTWPIFQQAIPPEKMVSDTRRVKLEQLIPELFEKGSLTTNRFKAFYLADAVELEFGSSQKVSPELAKQLGQLINNEFINELAKQNETEHENLLQVLGKAYFKAQDGEYHHVRTVLSEPLKTSELQEESHQSDLNFFKVLSSDYTDQAVIFFKACRRQYEMAELSEMAEQLQIPMLQKLVIEDKEKCEQQKKNRDKKATNKKIGENVELIIKKILHNNGCNVKTIYVGGDLEIWPKEDAGWDSGYITISSKITVEIKFTIGSKVHLTRCQSETARSQKSGYIVLVVNGDRGLRELLNVDIDEDSISDELITAIKHNSHVVTNLYEKLGELPNLKEIEPDIHGYWLKKPLWENQDNIVTWLENEF